jgi:Domain of unknown function (DUF222)
VLAALAEGTVLSESMARLVSGWTDKIPADSRDAADEILVTAARAGATGRTWPSWPRRSTPGPCGRARTTRTRTGNLTAECAAVITAVLESLSAPAGAEDTRTREQRYHDALEDAMRRLVASGLLPERAGQPVRVWAHVPLAELRALDDGSVLAQEWVGEMAIGTAARAISCDAAVIPVVTGQVDPAALDRLVGLCLQFAGHGPRCAAAAGQGGDPDPADQPGQPADPPAAARQPEDPAGRGGDPSAPGPRPPTPQAQEMLRHAIIRAAVDLVSGPRRAGLLPAHPAARRPAGRPQPAAGRRAQPRDPRRHPPRGHPARPALPLGRQILPLNTH